MKSCPWKDENWGMVLPTELMIIHNVIIIHHSPETFCPTCSVPTRVTMLGDCTDVDTPVSSILYTLNSSKFPRFKCVLIIVEIFHYIYFIEPSVHEQTCIFELAKCEVLVSFGKAL
jgi:hypothetical protein